MPQDLPKAAAARQQRARLANGQADVTDSMRIAHREANVKTAPTGPRANRAAIYRLRSKPFVSQANAMATEAARAPWEAHLAAAHAQTVSPIPCEPA